MSTISDKLRLGLLSLNEVREMEGLLPLTSGLSYYQAQQIKDVWEEMYKGSSNAGKLAILDYKNSTIEKTKVTCGYCRRPNEYGIETCKSCGGVLEY